MILLKLGGSFITYKKNDCSPPYRKNELSLNYRIRKDRIHRIAKVIRDHGDTGFIIIHGGGTHGHRTVTRWKTADIRAPRELMAWEVRWRMDQLSLEISSVLGKEKVPTVTVPSSDLMMADKGSISDIRIEPLERIIERKCIPMLRGDLVPDRDGGWSVVSGDTLIEEICKKEALADERIDKVVMIMDAEGFMDPVTNKIVGEISSGRFENSKDAWKEGIATSKGDVSGGIWGKLITLRRIADRGVEAFIIGDEGAGPLEKVLDGKRAGTRFPPGK